MAAPQPLPPTPLGTPVLMLCVVQIVLCDIFWDPTLVRQIKGRVPRSVARSANDGLDLYGSRHRFVYYDTADIPLVSFRIE